MISTFRFGGVSTQSFLLAKFLKQHGYKPIVLATTIKDKRFCELLDSYNIEYALLQLDKSKKGILKIYYYYKSLVKALNRYTPFAILPFNKNLGYSINLIWRFTGAKMSFHMERNNGEETLTTWIGRLLRKLSMLNATALIYNSQAASFVSPFPRKTRVIKNRYLNSVDKISKDSNEMDFTIDPNVIMILHVANISPQKNYNLILDSWPMLIGKVPNLVLVIVGDISRNTDAGIAQKINQNGIIYSGAQSNVLPFIKRANICMLSTFREGCPNVILEYMANKKLIVASDIPSIREVLAISNHNYLFDNGSSEDLIEKVLRALALDENTIQQMAADNYNKLNADYSEDNYLKVIELLES